LQSKELSNEYVKVSYFRTHTISVKFAAFNLTMTCLTLVASAFLLTLSTLENTLPPPRLLVFCLEFLQKLLPCIGIRINDGKFGQDGTAVVDTSEPVKYHWAKMTRAVKFVLFIFCLVLYSLVSFFCLIV